ncbi:hypothetical protein [Actomonas aquatica]|uniref:Glycosyltransferase RgtA/B/C/D-like domain-containing protein n=1 Tax=Actomonas aquatica TaxID=2866162 RepID=A0ABZ1CB14_9BACT|nr:hypothetical protein [Opitutus sp. WL0086]WRQ88507.1 hypothetical protein K1X11_003770 [Opitutus sp. WL0086]
MSAAVSPTPSSASPATSAPQPYRPGEVLLWLLLTLLALTLPQKPLLELDSSWRQALAYFFQRDYQFGTEVVFTYGPLGFLLGNTYVGLYFYAYVAFQVAFSAIAAGLIVHMARPLSGVARFAYFTFFILWGVGYGDALHMIVIAFCGWNAVKALAEGRSPRPVLLGLFLAFLAVIKFTNLLFAGFVVAVAVGFGLVRGERRAALWLLGCFGLGFLALWVACGQSLLNLPAYVLHSLDVSSGYQAAMGLPTPRGETGYASQLTLAFLTFAMLGAYLVWHALTQPDRLRSAALVLILAAFLFLNWKHGFVRADGHMLGFFYCALVPAVAFPALFGETLARRRWVPRVALGLAAFFCLSGMRGTFTSNIDYAPNITNEKLQYNLQYLLDWDRFRGDLGGQLDHWRREGELEKTKQLVGDASLDVLGYEQAIALFNNFNYTPRPIFQSYSVYTPKLTELNAEFITSERAPEFLLLKLQTIDERPLLMDDSQLMAFFPHLYTFKLLEKDFYLFQRRAEHAPIESLRPRRLRTLDLEIGQPLSLSEYGDRHLWIEIDLPFSLTGKARSFLYKPPFVHLEVTDVAGEIFNYRLPLTSARAGFQINPLVLDFESYLEAHGGKNPHLVKSVRLVVDKADRHYFADTALVSLSSLQPTALKQEYEKQLEREKFSMFSELPLDFSSATAPSKLKIDGREALVMHAPSLMTFPFRAGTQHIRGAHGYPPGAYTNGGETDGALFRILWTDGTEERELYARELQPFTNEADRGLVDFDVSTADLPAGTLRFEISIRDHPAWDWTTWADIVIE